MNEYCAQADIGIEKPLKYLEKKTKTTEEFCI